MLGTQKKPGLLITARTINTTQNVSANYAYQKRYVAPT